MALQCFETASLGVHPKLPLSSEVHMTSLQQFSWFRVQLCDDTIDRSKHMTFFSLNHWKWSHSSLIALEALSTRSEMIQSSQHETFNPSAVGSGSRRPYGQVVVLEFGGCSTWQRRCSASKHWVLKVEGIHEIRPTKAKVEGSQLWNLNPYQNSVFLSSRFNSTKKAAMKDDQHRSLNLHSHQRTRLSTTKLFTHTTAYVILVLFSYAMGYLSRSSPAQAQQQRQQLPQLTPPVGVGVGVGAVPQVDNFRVTARCSNSLVPPHLVFPTILDRVFNNTSPYTNFPPPYLRAFLRGKRIKGWGSNGAVFQHLIQRVKPRVIIEVGTFLGASALHMFNVTRKLGLQTQILCLDDFRGWPGFRDHFKDMNMINGDVLLLQQFLQNVAYFNATESVLPVPFSTGSGLEKLCEWGITGDLIEIDAGHDFISAWGDINRAYRLLRPGGIIFGHDYFTAADNRGVRRAVNLFAKMNNLKIKTDGQHWVIDTTSAKQI
ncbi:hypothetical protein V6N13_087053 [Hibiscus sabdariffa]